MMTPCLNLKMDKRTVPGSETLAEIPSLTSSHVAVNHLRKNLVAISSDREQNRQPVHDQDKSHVV